MLHLTPALLLCTPQIYSQLGRREGGGRISHLVFIIYLVESALKLKAAIELGEKSGLKTLNSHQPYRDKNG